MSKKKNKKTVNANKNIKNTNTNKKNASNKRESKKAVINSNDNKTIKNNAILSVILCCVMIPIFTFGWLFYGPFETSRRIWICTAMSTGSHKYLATAFFSDATIEKYTSQYFNVINDLPFQNMDLVDTSNGSKNITVEDVRIGLARGKLMRIYDPSRIDVAICDYEGNSGMKLNDLIEQENAIAGINAGAYIQVDGSPNGSIPGGLIVKDGELVKASWHKTNKFCVIGFDNNNKMVVNYWNTEEIKSQNLRCAISFGPPLILNGEPLIEQASTSLQPRTAIGQCADGSVLFLVLDGRQPSSAGATLMQVQEILVENGAVVAANLDGGSSAAMMYKGEVLNSPSDNKELKRIPTAFVVKE